MNDLIERKAAIDAIRNDRIDTSEPYISVFKATGDLEKVESVNMACDRHIKMLNELPSAQPEKCDNYNCISNMCLLCIRNPNFRDRFVRGE